MIKFQNISKSFSNQQILNDITFKIDQGDSVAIIGQSGVGKSVLLKHVNGLLKPNRGNVFVNNQNINKLSFEELQIIRKKMAMVFQFGALFDSMTISENIMIALDNLTKLSKQDKIDRVQHSLKMVNLSNIDSLFPSNISGGMKKRVGIARAISSNPEYILYDEPTTGLDPINTDKMISLMHDIGRKNKMTSIIVTHEMRIVNELVNKVIMLHEGNIIFDGTPKELNSSSDKYIKYFILGKSKGLV